MRAVNLLPRDAERVRRGTARTPLLVAAGGAAAVTSAAVVFFLSASGTADELRTQLAETRAALAAVPSTGRPAVTSAALVQERSDRVVALAAALSTRIPFDRLLREVSFVLPEDAWLTGITATAPADSTAVATAPGTAPAPSSTGQEGVTIQGSTYSHESVARVLARLSALPPLMNVRLTASTRVVPQTDESDGAKKKVGKTTVAFTIAATLRTESSS
ncbi:MAG TPA: PilN domain-containing protein [Gaiellaceae bacterium]|nr:PilN domain-containing protein [Gaiellaceae bacterium]